LPATGSLVTLLPWAGLTNKNTWFTLTASLANYAGQTVTLYFEQMDGGQGNGEYRYVDNIAVLTAGPALYLPAAPRLLSAVAGNSVSLLWRDNDQSEAGFKIERSLGTNGIWSEIASLSTNATGYADASVSAGTTYSYRMRSWNAQGFSPYSNAQIVTTPPRPLLATALSASTLMVTWPTWASNFTLYTTSDLLPPVVWAPVGVGGRNTGSNLAVSLPVGTNSSFFQLEGPP